MPRRRPIGLVRPPKAVGRMRGQTLLSLLYCSNPTLVPYSQSLRQTAVAAR